MLVESSAGEDISQGDRNKKQGFEVPKKRVFCGIYIFETCSLFFRYIMYNQPSRKTWKMAKKRKTPEKKNLKFAVVGEILTLEVQ